MGVVQGAALAIALTLAGFARARAESVPAPAAAAAAANLDCRVLWAEPMRAYLLARDSGDVAVGAQISFLDRTRIVSTGVVENVAGGRLATVLLARGALDPRRLGRIRVEIVPPPEMLVRAVPAPTTLRIGVPFGARGNLAIPCPIDTLNFTTLAVRYRLEPLGDGGVRAVGLTGFEYPETLIVRRFRDATDQEIAHERGEIDVAVFWPGEPSTRARKSPRGEWILGYRLRGALTLRTGSAGQSVRIAASGDSRLKRMNEELFGGDLAEWSFLDRERVRGTWGAAKPDDFGYFTPPPTPVLPEGRGFSVDESIPGRQTIEHFLNGGATMFERGKLGPMRMGFEDLPIQDTTRGAPDAYASAHDQPIFAMRCPILCAPETRSYVLRIGVNALADLVQCAPHPSGR